MEQLKKKKNKNLLILNKFYLKFLPDARRIIGESVLLLVGY